MKIRVKDFAVSMELGNNGISLDVYDNSNKHLGDLRIGKATIEWCKGKTQKGNGNKVSWEKLTQWLESQPG